MAATIPTALKQADIARFAQRAGQLEKAKPVVAYWCNYWIVNQILSKGLHNSDDESMTYTMHLMDKLEQSKADHRDNEAIVDDLVGQAYVEQFGMETLERAENAMKLNKATRQTADTFLASATFLELCQIWGPLDPAITSKIKYAKYHAVRIAKAIKAGEDPNLSNPALMEPSAIVQPPVQFRSSQLQPPDDMKQEEQDRVRSTTYQPLVEDASDEHELSEPQIAQSLNLSKSPSTSETTSQDPTRESHRTASEGMENYNKQLGHDNLSAMEPAQAGNVTFDAFDFFPKKSGSEGVEQPVPTSQEIPWDERAPSPPPDTSFSSDEKTPSPPPDTSFSSLATPSSTSMISGPQPLATRPSISLQSFPPPNMDRLPPSENPTVPLTSYLTQSSNTSRNLTQPTNILPPNTLSPPRPPKFYPQSSPTSEHSTNPPQSQSQTVYLSDEEAIMKAQKHARWAISALDFEDVSTAVKDLKIALESLGAR